MKAVKVSKPHIRWRNEVPPRLKGGGYQIREDSDPFWKDASVSDVEALSRTAGLLIYWE